MRQTISSHNKSLLIKPAFTPPADCNCRAKDECPLDGKCQQVKGVIYQATVTRQDNQKEETYIGLTESTFKIRYYGHTCCFENRSQSNKTTLSQYIWLLKDKGVDYSINWKIVAKSRPYSTTSKKCSLCLTEKYFITHHPLMSSLNKRNELVSGCRHRRKHLLENYKKPKK